MSTNQYGAPPPGYAAAPPQYGPGQPGFAPQAGYDPAAAPYMPPGYAQQGPQMVHHPGPQGGPGPYYPPAGSYPNRPRRPAYPFMIRRSDGYVTQYLESEVASGEFAPLTADQAAAYARQRALPPAPRVQVVVPPTPAPGQDPRIPDFTPGPGYEQPNMAAPGVPFQGMTPADAYYANAEMAPQAPQYETPYEPTLQDQAGALGGAAGPQLPAAGPMQPPAVQSDLQNHPLYAQLDQLTKPQLVEHAQAEYGVQLSERSAKAAMIETIIMASLAAQ